MSSAWCLSWVLVVALAAPVAQVEEGAPVPRRTSPTGKAPAAIDPAAPETALIDTPAIPPGYGRLLRNHAVPIPLDGGALETAFDYAKLINHPMQERLRADLRDRFTSVDVASLDQRTRTAWAINAYNFFVIDLIADHFVGSDGQPLASIRDIAPGEGKVFDVKRYVVGEETLSLNQFERKFLFSKTKAEDGGKAPLLDPRIHFALVCAAKGCPPLLPQPFSPEKLNKQLEEAAQNALANPRHLRVADGEVLVSQVFDWYKADFKAMGGVKAFVQRYAPAGTLPRGDLRVVPTLPWDWSLNTP